MQTREIYQINQSTGERTYAGYGKFDESGKYLGSYGGYGKGKKENNKNNKASKVQNVIATSGARQAKRSRAAGVPGY